MKKVTIKQICSWIAESEGKKKELSIAQIKEVVSIISDLSVGPKGGEVINALTSNGIRRK